MTHELPLEGIKVLDLTVMLAAPEAAMILGELGAEVAKIEAPGGDPLRHISPGGFAAYNAGKSAMVVDLKTEPGRALVRTMAERADVLIAGLRPGVLGRLGLEYAQLAATCPRLVHASLTGFPNDGLDATPRRGTDQVLQAESGMMSLTGYADGEPLRVGFSVIDVVAGHVLAEMILAALLRRGRTNAGAEITVSLLEVALQMQAMPLAEFCRTGIAPTRFGNSHVLGAPAGVFSTASGPLIVGAYLQPHWQTLCQVLGVTQLLDDERFRTPGDRVRHRGELEAILAAEFATQPAEQWYPKLVDAGILVGRVQCYEQLGDLLSAHGVMVAADDPALAGRTVLPPFGGLARPSGQERRVPSLGADAERILQDWGVPAERVSAAIEAGALIGIADPSPV